MPGPNSPLYAFRLALPRHVFDLHTAYLSVSNILLPYEPELKRIKAAQGFV